jgi:hypothetical protein
MDHIVTGYKSSCIEWFLKEKYFVYSQHVTVHSACGFRDTLVITIRPKIKYTFPAAIMLFYIQQRICIAEVVFLKGLLPYFISGPYFRWH